MDEPGLCTARWATANRAHREGDLCGEPAAERLGDIDLCAHHYGRALDWFYKCHVPEAPERMEAARREASERARLIAEERSIVYYLRRESDGLIKIGFSTNYPSRLNTLRAEHGPLRLLLATAGGRKEEDKAHLEFAALQVTGEWFRPERPLLLWIMRAREAARYRTGTRLPEQAPLKEVRILLRQLRAAA